MREKRPLQPNILQPREFEYVQFNFSKDSRVGYCQICKFGYFFLQTEHSVIFINYTAIHRDLHDAFQNVTLAYIAEVLQESQ